MQIFAPKPVGHLALYAQPSRHNQRQCRKFCRRQAALRSQRIVRAHEHAPFLVLRHTDIIIFVHVDGLQQESYVQQAFVHLFLDSISVRSQ